MHLEIGHLQVPDFQSYRDSTTWQGTSQQYLAGYMPCLHYIEVIMNTMVSQITSFMIVYSTVYSGTDQRKHQSFASLAFLRGIHWWPVNSTHKGPVTWKMFPFDDVIMDLNSLAPGRCGCNPKRVNTGYGLSYWAHQITLRWTPQNIYDVSQWLR